MQPITHPLRVNDSGPQVANLQEALWVLVDKQVIPVPDWKRLEIEAAFDKERQIQTFGSVTGDLVASFRERVQLGVEREVNAPTAAAMNKWLTELGTFDAEGAYCIQGRVMFSDGRPAFGYFVRAFDCALRKEQQIGKKVVTDAMGHWEIRHSTDPVTSREPRKHISRELLVQVLDANNTLLVESRSLFKGSDERTIDLVIAAPTRSEWQKISDTVIPFLLGQGNNNDLLSPSELNDKDIDSIVWHSGIDREQLRLWIQAHKTAHTTQLLGNAAREDFLEAMVFYGWFRDGQPRSSDALIQVPSDTLMASLERAIAQGYIPATEQKNKDMLRQALRSANDFVVRGTVTDSKGKPVANAIVRAFHRDLRNRRLLGQDRTGRMVDSISPAAIPTSRRRSSARLSLGYRGSE
ncbi:MAG: carboxypeptidase regulatory-like domain-containing protein [Acidobacteria bacterium]|nr:carboxypeptidase regulatory-like domain-containing protein [Acidobacteriota bacterium]